MTANNSVNKVHYWTIGAIIMLLGAVILLICSGLAWTVTICRISNQCDQCKLLNVGQKCLKDEQYEHLFCNTTDNRINIYENSYLFCDTRKNELIAKRCASDEHFVNGTCLNNHQHRKRREVAGSGRVGDYCSVNADCLNGMFCSVGACTCRSNFVTIHGYCYLKKNIGENGCQYSEQCNSAWPGARCVENKCECPSDINGIPYVQAHTRDGTICILLFGDDDDPVPKCPLPEYDDDLLAMPITQLRNPAMTDPDDDDILAGEQINPLQFCSSTSTDYNTFVANGGGACTYATEPYQPENGIYIADIYDCVTVPLNNVKLAMKGIYNIHPQADGICCPNRAFTCMQPKREAKLNVKESAGVRPRWWFNSVTGICEQFMWDPWDETEVQSPNNFKTREHCESYCKDSCKRGAPEYSVGRILNEEEPITNCQTINSCSTNFECKANDWREVCCPSVTSICSIAGGRPLDPSRHTNFDPGYSMKRMFNLNFEKSRRYYYDSEQGRCTSFTYNGALGNFNNFKSLSDCELFCEKLQCKHGTALKIRQVTQRCNRNSHCPSTHECQMDNKICCPKLHAICSQPLRLGNCKENIRRYWYDAVNHACQIFNYTGCQGNDNNFETLLECQNTCNNIIPKPRCPQGDAYKDNKGNYFICSDSNSAKTCPSNYECHFDGNLWSCCPTREYTCQVSFSKGVTCDIPSSYRYFYNSQIQECENFLYNGCGGNSNNFQSYEQCESYCNDRKCPNGGSPKRNEFNKQIDCSSTVSCPNTHECTSLTSGNSIVNRCCPKRAYICSLPPHQGNSCGTSVVTRFYFNIASKECIEFTYNGCGGNLNNFATFEQCNNFCLSSACASGDIVHVNPSTHMQLECRSDVSNSCPNNFTCTYDELFGKNVCCGATNMEVCPSGEKAYMNAFNMSVRECLINISTSCPDYYLCRFHMQTNRYYCCASINEDICPRGRAVYKDQSSKLPIRCIISSGSNQCPVGYNCFSDVPGALQGYCCSSNYLCPNGAKFYSEIISKMPRSCQLNSPFITCPIGYTCQNAETELMTGYCCENDNTSVSDGCPPNKYVYMRDNEVISCDPFNSLTNVCPRGYSCQWSLPKRRYQCCGNASMLANKITKTCQEGELLIADECLERSEPGDLCIDDKQCLGGSRCKDGICECINGYIIYHGKCIIKEAKSAKIKCSISSQIPYYEKGSKKVRYCSNLKNSCPKGYSCQFSRDAGRNICCGHLSGISIIGRSNSSSKSTINVRNHFKVSVDICNDGTPYMLKGIPQTCTMAPCPIGFDCIFIKKAQNYFCCKRKIKEEVQNDGCPSGTALLFPTTGTPLQCNNAKQSSCPNGYRCLRSIKNNGYQCCTSAYNPFSRFYQTSINAISCPGSQVQVRRYMNGQYLNLCEDHCPIYQIAVNGFCKSLADLI
ncbi:Kunitz/Bovine pancreatic trypsin inhibitor domain family protein [Brugia pahangi]